MGKPERTHTYVNHTLDSTRWDYFRPRGGDVVIATSPKSGTTWMQRILSLFAFGPGELPDTLSRLSPQIDLRVGEPVEELVDRIDAQSHRRFLKSHLPLDALPYFEGVRYIMVGRDTRDVFMSLWNHYRSYTDIAYERLGMGDPPGGPLPRCPDNISDYWRQWITRASFPWENDGWPFWSHHYHAGSFWTWRHLPNVLLVHYNDLKADLQAEMRRIAAFTGFDIADQDWPHLVHAATFETMSADADRLIPEATYIFGSTRNFLYRGTNDRWRGALTAADLALYERRASTLDPDLRAWLESGRRRAEPPPSGMGAAERS